MSARLSAPRCSGSSHCGSAAEAKGQVEDTMVLQIQWFQVEIEKKLGIGDKKYKKRFVKVLARRRKVNLVDPHSPAEKKILRRKAD